MIEKEKCVSCEKETEEDINTPIDHRDYYVEGVGQLCKDCWVELYLELYCD